MANETADNQNVIDQPEVLKPRMEIGRAHV